jgi:uncharacterized protein YndB with AHSA1/START domain
MAEIRTIDTHAPVISWKSIEIDAPRQEVWRLHLDVEHLPDWNPGITDTEVAGPPAPGGSFTWRTAGVEIHSTVYQLDTPSRVLWGGRVDGIMGIHEWRFRDDGNGGTKVETQESWSGAPVEADIGGTQKALDDSLDAWLASLKAAAEAA